MVSKCFRWEINFAKVSHFGKVKEVSGIRCQASGDKKGLPDKIRQPHCVITQFLNKSNITYEKCIFQN